MMLTKLPLILAIDTSCDDTAAAITLGRIVLSNIVASQTDLHQPYGGVFPTVAKQAHKKNIKPVINKALKQAGVTPQQLDAIAVTLGPGLAPALEVGIATAQELATTWHKPLIPVNHIEAHALSSLAVANKKIYPVKSVLSSKKYMKKINPQLIAQFPITSQADFNQQNIFPVLAIVVSGGHSEFIKINQLGAYEILGQTIDDALGEALDKVGRMLGLGYPAAPVIEKVAVHGDENKFKFPLPMTTSNNFNLSYSGLKTAASRLISQLQADSQLNQQTILDLAASFQYACFRHLTYKLDRLLVSQNYITDPKFSSRRRRKFSRYARCKANVKPKPFKQVWLGGGVSQNNKLRKMLRQTLRPFKLKLITPYSKRICADNAAMIGVTASFHWFKNLVNSYPLKLDRKPNWSIID